VRPFRLLERKLEADCLEIEVEGELEQGVAGWLRQALEKAVEGRNSVIVGLERCEFIDSTGIAVIVWANKRLRDSGAHLALHGPSGQVLRTLDVTGLTENGLVFTTAAEARAACGAAARAA
jgi:anti-anti-sigma factor